MLFLFLTLAFGKLLADVNIELDVVFSDSTVECRYLYVLNTDNDTIAVFDTLSFNRDDRVSLFYKSKRGGKNALSMVDGNGTIIESKPFNVLYGNVFSVVIGKEQVTVSQRDFLYFRKNADNTLYISFLLILLATKLLITSAFVLTSALHKRMILVAFGAFLLSAFIDWLFMLHYLFRFLLITLTEYLFIATVGRKSISWYWSALLVLIVNFVSFGFLAFLFIFYLFY